MTFQVYQNIEKSTQIAYMHCQKHKFDNYIKQWKKNIVWLAEIANTQLAEIKTTILQASNAYKIQIAKDIFSILEDLWDIIQGNIKNQAYHIQVLVADEFDRCKGKENQLVKKHIKTIQNAYQETHKLYKPYDILSKSSKLKTSELIFVQDKVNYKTLQSNGEQSKQY